MISPLKLAIKNNNFKLANYLIKLGANTEFYDFFQSYKLCYIINTGNIEYFLNKGYKITSDLLKELIEINKNDCLCSILKYLSSPLFSRNFTKEYGFKPLLRKSIYKFCIDNNNYNGLSFYIILIQEIKKELQMISMTFYQRLKKRKNF